MSRIFGPVAQNGYVVENIFDALKYWTEVLGVGPFFLWEEVRFETFTYKGEVTDPLLHIAVANSGDLQIELIEQVNEAPSYYKDFIEQFGPGLQHMSVWTGHFERDLARYQSLGMEPFMSGVSAGSRFGFYGSPNASGLAMEVFECPPRVMENMLAIRAAAKGWDGSAPVRRPSAGVPLA